MNMLQSYSPVGKFIFLTYQNPHVLDGATVLQTKLNNLVIRLKNCVTEIGIDSACKKMEDDFFALRFEILEYLQAHPTFLENFETGIIEQIGVKYFTPGKFKEIGNAVSNTLEVYLLMFGKLANEIAGNIPQSQPISNEMKNTLTLSSLRHINSLQPNPELGIVIEWFSASVQYDFYLIVSEFVIREEIIVGDADIQQISRSLKRAIVNFGTYTVLSGLWEPTPDDESPLVRNIKIRAAAYQLDAGHGKSASLQNLQALLLS